MMTVWQRAARVQCMCTHADATSTFPAAQMHFLGNAAVAQVRCALANQLLSRIHGIHAVVRLQGGGSPASAPAASTALPSWLHRYMNHLLPYQFM